MPATITLSSRLDVKLGFEAGTPPAAAVCASSSEEERRGVVEPDLGRLTVSILVWKRRGAAKAGGGEHSAVPGTTAAIRR